MSTEDGSVLTRPKPLDVVVEVQKISGRGPMKRLRFFNETSRPTVPLDSKKCYPNQMNTHNAVWHNTEPSWPPENEQYLLAVYTHVVPPGHMVDLTWPVTDGAPSRAGLVRFRIDGHPESALYIISEEPLRSILEAEVHVFGYGAGLRTISRLEVVDVDGNRVWTEPLEQFFP
ncbi:MAG: hypothetical protein QNJ90_11095 [Planctomycetota bacterium]|nr:hypothetical protein [Planctomycetota bacterium]